MKFKVVTVILISILLVIVSCKKDNSSNSIYKISPVLTLNLPITQYWQKDSTPYVDPGYTAHDTIDGNLTVSVVITGTVIVTELGTYTLDYNVKDKGGLKAAQQSRTVIVEPKSFF